MESAYFLCQR